MLAVEENTGITPKALLERPQLEEHLEFYWQVFSELNKRDRPESVASVNHLPFRAFLDYAHFHNFSKAEAQDCWEVVSLIDDLWVREVKKRQAASAAKAKSQAAAHAPKGKPRP